VKVALGQINPTIGDFEGNRRLVLEATAAAEAQGAELVLFPELSLAGYPPRDLLERSGFLDAAAASLAALTSALSTTRAAVVVGFPERLPPGPSGRTVANSAALIEDGRVTHVVRKSLLPTYDVFDEWRYFEPAAEVAPVPFRGRMLGLSICEDIWNDADFWPRRLYRRDPIEALVRGCADLIANISASPYTMQKRHLRPRMLASTASRWERPLLFVNQVGGQDDLVFDGASMAFDAARGRVVMFGGDDNSQVQIHLGDTWTWDGTDWTVHTAGSLRLGSQSGSAGDFVGVQGWGFLPGERIRLTFLDSAMGAVKLKTVTADPSGAFQGHVRVPAGASPGKQAIRAVGTSSGDIAKQWFTVT